MKKRIVGSEGLRRVEQRISTLDELQAHFTAGEKIRKRRVTCLNGPSYYEFTVKSEAGVLIGFYSTHPQLKGGWVNYWV